MAIIKSDIFGNPNIGVYALATDSYLILPPNVPEKKVKLFEENLAVKAVLSTIHNSSIVGVLAAGNTHGIVFSSLCYDEELENLKRELPDIAVARIESKYTAFGNLILANDKGAIASPYFKQKTLKQLEDILSVEVVTGKIANMPNVGSLAVATNQGVLAHPHITEEERRLIEDVLKVPVREATINCGVPYMRTGIIANKNGAIVGTLTTGPELVIISQALGL